MASGPKRRPVQDQVNFYHAHLEKIPSSALTPRVTWKLNTHCREFHLNGHNMSFASDEELALKNLAFEYHYVGCPVHVMGTLFQAVR